MYISDLIEDFLEHLEIESGRSKKTIDNYRLYLERFLEISQEILNKDDILCLLQSTKKIEKTTERVHFMV